MRLQERIFSAEISVVDRCVPYLLLLLLSSKPINKRTIEGKNVFIAERRATRLDRLSVGNTCSQMPLTDTQTRRVLRVVDHRSPMYLYCNQQQQQQQQQA